MISPAEILGLNLQEVWILYNNLFSKLSKSTDDEGNRIKPFATHKELEQAKNGIKIRFNIEWYFPQRRERYFVEKPKSRMMVIKAGDRYWIDDFLDEIQARDNLMRNALLEYFSEDKDVTKLVNR